MRPPGRRKPAAPGALARRTPAFRCVPIAAEPGRVWTAWRHRGASPRTRTWCQLPDGRLLAVYADADSHWAEELIRLTLIQVPRPGAPPGSRPAWSPSRTAPAREPHWVTQGLALLRGRALAMTCDLDNYEHSHEYQEPGIYVWWSIDLGQTWSSPGEHGHPGDRAGPHHRAARRAPLHGLPLCLPAETQKHAEYICALRADAEDLVGARRGRWRGTAVHMYCEGAYLPPAELAPCCACCGTTCTTTTPPRWPSPSTSARPGRSRGGPLRGGPPRSSGSSRTGVTLSPSATREATGAPYAWLGNRGEARSPPATASRPCTWGPRRSRSPPGRASTSPTAGRRRPVQPAPSGELPFGSALRRARPRREPQWRAPDKRCALVQLAHVNVRLTLAPNGLYLSDFDSQPRLIDRHYPAGPDPLASACGCATPPGWCGYTWTARTCCASACRPPVPSSPPASGSLRDGMGTSCWQTVS